MTNEIKLALIGLIPVIVSVILYGADRKWLYEMDYWLKQVLIGLIFGTVAIIGTEFGVDLNGATMNARDAAPLCAGLIFGGPAGLLAGLIGGVERFLAVQWGAGSFTAVACSISTFLAGVYGALLHKQVFDYEIPKWIYALAAGAITEVTHMLMVFIFRLNYLQKAFEVVRACTVPMVLVNSLAVMLACVLIRVIYHPEDESISDKRTLSQVFQARTLIVCLVAFVLTTFANVLIGQKLAYRQCEQLLKLNLEDAKQSVVDASDANLLNLTRRIMGQLDPSESYDCVQLQNFANTFEVAEINLVDANNLITQSNVEAYLGFDMNSGEQSKVFAVLNQGTESYVQILQPTTYDRNIYRKYAGVAFQEGGYLQVGYDAIHFEKELAEEIAELCHNRHIGNSGSFFVIDNNNHIISSFAKASYNDAGRLGLRYDELLQNKGAIQTIQLSGEDYYAVSDEAEGYLILAVQPVKEALLSANMATYVNVFLEILVFTGIFLMVYFVVRYTIVKNIVHTNNSLARITAGELETVVDVRDDQEFDSLSNGINATVNRLKQYIQEAKDRIDAELRYASEIQHAALPSNFPAFPDRYELDIYASMDAAKSVGGDFYDFYFVDRNKLVFLIADVSGKGIPASLFMMRSKTLIKTYAEYGISVHDIFTNVNFNLCEGNDAGLFVTAWIGLLDLESGHLVYANAGHNPPLIRQANGHYQYLVCKPGFVLGGMEGIAYKCFETDLKPGDAIYLYTDGVTEAQNSQKQLYGEHRLQAILNKCENDDCQTLCTKVKADVERFVGDADQFDDLTMLSLRYLKKAD